MWQGALLGAGAGYGKNILVDQPRERRQREMAAKMAVYSPWTGINPVSLLPEETSAFESMFQGGTAGAMMQQGAESAEAQNKMADAYSNKMNADTEVQMPKYSPRTPEQQQMSEDNYKMMQGQPQQASLYGPQKRIPWQYMGQQQTGIA